MAKQKCAFCSKPTNELHRTPFITRCLGVDKLNIFQACAECHVSHITDKALFWDRQANVQMILDYLKAHGNLSLTMRINSTNVRNIMAAHGIKLSLENEMRIADQILKLDLMTSKES